MVTNTFYKLRKSLNPKSFKIKFLVVMELKI